jgi:transcriptional regulator with XRE-family HTH domain
MPFAYSGGLYDIRRDSASQFFDYRRMPVPCKPPSSVFGRRLREARLAKGIPQDRLGVLAGLDEATASARISRYESGTHQPPFSFSERLASVLEVPAAFFYAADDRMAALIEVFGSLSPARQNAVLRSLVEERQQARTPKPRR